MSKENIQKAYRRWLIQAPLGLSIIGFGACLIADAAVYKYDGAETLHWVAYGTLALVIFNTGLSIFGDSIIWRTRYERWRSQ